MDQVVRLIDQFWFKSKDYCDKPDSSVAKLLQNEVRQIHDEAKMGKQPDYLFSKVKNLERSLQELKNNDGIYSAEHVEDMHDRCIDLEKLLRELSKLS